LCNALFIFLAFEHGGPQPGQRARLGSIYRERAFSNTPGSGSRGSRDRGEFVRSHAWGQFVLVTFGRGRLRWAGLLATVALFTLPFAASALAADQTYVNGGSFASEGTADGQLTHPRRIAVENSTATTTGSSSSLPTGPPRPT
jgi:hypothetical protein